MLLDGSVVETSEQQVAMERLLHAVFQVDRGHERSCFDQGPALKLSSIPALLEARLRTAVHTRASLLNEEQPGRVGPAEVKIRNTALPASAGCYEAGELCSRSNFATVRANACVFEGKWMFEATLFSAGILQIGWATLSATFTSDNGVGDSPDSYAYDGKRQRKWNVSQKPYGENWAPGDVIGCCLDLDENTLTYYRNGKCLGVAYDDIKSKQEGMAYFPAASLSYGEKCLLNFGAMPLSFPVEGYQVLQRDGEVYGSLAQYLTGCISRLLPLQRAALLSANAKQAAGALEGLEGPAPSSDDVLLLYANILEVVVPLWTRSRHAVMPLYHLLLELDDESLHRLFEVLSLALAHKEAVVLVENLLSCITYCARTASWVPPGQGSTPMVALFDRLLKVPMVATLCQLRFDNFSNSLEQLMGAALPNQEDLRLIIELPDQPDYSVLLPPTEAVQRLQEGMKRNEQAIASLFRSLLTVEDGHPLHGALQSWLKKLLKRNVMTTGPVPALNTSSQQTLTNIFTGFYLALEDELALPFQGPTAAALLFRSSDQQLMETNRIGGTLRHLRDAHPVEAPAADTLEGVATAELFEYLLLLARIGPCKALKQAEERHAQNALFLKRWSQSEPQARASLERKRLPLILQCHWDAVFWQRDWQMPKLWGLMVRLGATLEYMAGQGSTQYKYVPEYYYSVLCGMFVALYRALGPRAAEEGYQEGLRICTGVFINSISAGAIQNADIKEKILIILTNLFRVPEYVRFVETHPAAGTLVPTLIDAFSTGHLWLLVSDLFVLFWKGMNFGRNKGQAIASARFQHSFVEFAAEESERVTTFINKLFNNLNSVLTEFRVLMQTLQPNVGDRAFKKAALMYDLSCKLLVIVEILSLACPQALLASRLHMIRLSELILLALATAQSPSYTQSFGTFLDLATREAAENMRVSFTYSLYGPLCGVLVNLREAQLQSAANLHVERVLAQVDGALDQAPFVALADFEWEKAKQTRAEAVPADLERFKSFLADLDVSYSAAVEERKKDEERGEDDDDDDTTCTICYSYDIDSQFVPCGHRSCDQCIQRHLLDHKNCFFCNAEITKVEKIDSAE